MAIERTFILCKPDAVSRGLIGEVTRIERRGYVITAMKVMQLDGERAREHYAEHRGKPFFDDLVTFITRGRSWRWPSKVSVSSTAAVS